MVSPADIISAVEFDKSGEHLATGDRGGRVVLFERLRPTKCALDAKRAESDRAEDGSGGFFRAREPLQLYSCTTQLRYVASDVCVWQGLRDSL